MVVPRGCASSKCVCQCILIVFLDLYICVLSILVCYSTGMRCIVFCMRFPKTWVFHSLNHEQLSPWDEYLPPRKLNMVNA